MKILLDECLPKRLKQELPGHDVATVPEMGWRGLKNGELLRSAESAFDVLITIDQGLRYQQNLRTSKLIIVVLVADNNRIETLRPLMRQVLNAIATNAGGSIIRISA